MLQLAKPVSRRAEVSLGGCGSRCGRRGLLSVERPQGGRGRRGRGRRGCRGRLLSGVQTAEVVCSCGMVRRESCGGGGGVQECGGGRGVCAAVGAAAVRRDASARSQTAKRIRKGLIWRSDEDLLIFARFSPFLILALPLLFLHTPPSHHPPLPLPVTPPPKKVAICNFLHMCSKRSD